MSTTINRGSVGTNDDGTGTTGTVVNTSYIGSAIYDPIDDLFDGTAALYLGGAIGLGRYTTTATGTQNDWDIDAAAASFQPGILRCNNATALTITGIVAPSDGRLLLIEAVGAGAVSLADQSGSSSAVNRIITGVGATTTLAAGTGRALLRYDATTQRWRVLMTSDPYSIVQTTTGTGSSSDFALTTNATELRCNNATALTLTGIAAGYDGQLLDIVSVGAGQVNLTNEDAASAAANRIANQVTGTINLAAGLGRVRLRYDTTTVRWRVLNHEQGDYITPAFSASDFTANGTMTWTVGSGDVLTAKYYLRGRQLHLMLSVTNTTVGGSLNTELRYTLPNALTAGARTFVINGRATDNGGTPSAGLVGLAAGDTFLRMYKDASGSANWSAATDATNVEVQLTIEVT